MQIINDFRQPITNYNLKLIQIHIEKSFNKKKSY
jgi:hypothetical protein